MAAVPDWKADIAYQPAVVADQGTTSPAVDLGGKTLCGVFIPSGLEGATLQVHASTAEDGTFVAVAGSDGTAQSITVAASRYIPLDYTKYLGLRYVKMVLATQTGAITLQVASKRV